MSELFKGVVKLTQEQFNTLKTDGTLTVGEQTITYEPRTTLYVTPDTTDAEIEQLRTELAGKQDQLTAGENITIENNVISASGGSSFDLSQLPKFTNKIYVNMNNKSTKDGILSIKIVASSNIYVDWGDGTNTLYESETTLIEHTYTDTAFAGWIYIYGDFKGIARNNTISTDNVPYLVKVIYDNNITSIGDSAFLTCKSLTSITIPNSVRSIENGAFRNCTNLTYIIIPDNVIHLQNGVFEGCSNLESVTIGNNVVSLQYGVFSGCTKLTSITIPENTGIGDDAFNGCSSLTSITIPSSRISLGLRAFANCSKLFNILLKPTRPPSINLNNLSPFLNTNIKQFLVPSQSLKQYKTATNWVTFADKIYPMNGQYSETITIPVASWASNSATVEVVGSTSEARNVIEFMLVDASGNQIEDTYGLKATQGTMQMTFTCETVPTEDIKIFVKSTLTNYD